MEDYLDEHARHVRQAVFLIAAAGILQRIGDAAVIWFAFSRDNPAPFLRGIAIGGLLCASVLLIGVCRRLQWARYFLVVFNWAYVAVFGFWVLQNLVEENNPTQSAPMKAVIAGILLYAAANVILVRSRRIRRFVNQ